MLKYKDLTKGWDLEGGKQVLPFPPQGLLNNPPKGISCEEWTKVMGASEEWPIAGSEMGEFYTPFWWTPVECTAVATLMARRIFAASLALPSLSSAIELLTGLLSLAQVGTRK